MVYYHRVTLVFLSTVAESGDAVEEVRLFTVEEFTLMWNSYIYASSLSYLHIFLYVCISLCLVQLNQWILNLRENNYF